MAPVREVTQAISRQAVMETNNESKHVHKKLPRGLKVRPLNENDFTEALKKVRRTGEAAQSFLKRDKSSSSGDRSSQRNNELVQAMQMMNMIINTSRSNFDDKNDDGGEEEDDVPSLT